ncbi:hypothetical protein SEA_TROGGLEHUMPER_96 [Rhodococcus phage Trogglehumper]|uniref:Uncharacterized protein n=1 Tax=Rhodococcus phage Trogglehumper TaxID=3038381 RepID=A0AAF0GPE3_9CAUD|nr:hypothetical protein SEA_TROGGLEHUMPER_96 [Rhodococcus phage Trogglehumper]
MPEMDGYNIEYGVLDEAVEHDEAARADAIMTSLGFLPLGPHNPTPESIVELADMLEANPHRSLFLSATRRGYGALLRIELERRAKVREAFEFVTAGLSSELLGSQARSTLADPDLVNRVIRQVTGKAAEPEDPKVKRLKVGDRIDGYCNGMFGIEGYDDERVVEYIGKGYANLRILDSSGRRGPHVVVIQGDGFGRLLEYANKVRYYDEQDAEHWKDAE